MKRPRRTLIVATVPDGSNMHVRTTEEENWPYASSLTISGGDFVKRARRFIPLSTGEPHSTYLVRMLVDGSGPVTLHNVGVQYSFVEG